MLPRVSATHSPVVKSAWHICSTFHRFVGEPTPRYVLSLVTASHAVHHMHCCCLQDARRMYYVMTFWILGRQQLGKLQIMCVHRLHGCFTPGSLQAAVIVTLGVVSIVDVW